MATHSSILTWRIPWTEEPDGLQSITLQSQTWLKRLSTHAYIVPWTARRLNQSTLKEINPEYSLEGLMLKLKLQYFGHLMWRADSLEKTLMLGKIEGKRRRGWQRMRWLHGIINSMDKNLSKLQVIVEDRGDWRAAVHGVKKSWIWLSDWITTSQNLS